MLGIEIFGWEFELYPELILALAALITATAGLLTAFTAMRKHGKNVKETAEEDCLRRLREARAEAEDVAKKLHDERMERFG